MNVAAIIDALRDPDPLARPMPMWFWNGRVDRDDLVAQMDEMAEQGIRAVFIHPMPAEFRPRDFGAGLDVEYLGDAYLSAVRAVCERAAERGMRIWLYDEGGWPSGHNLGRVIAERPDLRGKVARYNEQGQVEILERGFPVDLLDPDTARTFIAQVHEKYATAVGEFFGTVIPGIFTDESRIAGRVGGAEIPWTPRMPEEFKARKGYDLRLALPVLFGLKVAGSLPEPKRAQVRYDFLDVVTTLWRENWFGTLRAWCASHGLLLVGHLSDEMTLGGHVAAMGDFFRANDNLDWPGVDAIWRQIHPASPPTDFPKFASSAAHTRGRDRALSESYAVYGPDLTYGEMKRIADHQFVRGINALSPMALYADTRGPRMIGTMSDQFRANPLWPHYRDFAEYAGRVATLCSVGRPVVQVGVYYPVRSLWGRENPGIDSALAALGRGLLERQIDFDYLDDDAIAAARIDEGALAVGQCRYRALLFPTADLVPIETLRRARAFHDAGGIVRFTGDLPSFSEKAADAAELAGLREALWSCRGDALDDLPRTIALEAPNPDIRACRRSAGTADIWLVTNESTDQTHEIRACIPWGGRAWLYDPENGTVRRAAKNGDPIGISLLPGGSVAILAGEGEIDAAPVPDAPPPARTVPVEGPWSIHLLEQRIYLDGELVTLDREDFAPNGSVIPALLSWDQIFGKAVCGTAEYVATIQLDRVPARAVLDLGQVGAVAVVEVNDTSIGRRVWAPWRFDVGAALVPGANRIRVVVTSTLGRLMTAPSVVEDLKRRGWFNSYAERVATFGEPGPAGLLGPVRIEIGD